MVFGSNCEGPVRAALRGRPFRGRSLLREPICSPGVRDFRRGSLSGCLLGISAYTGYSKTLSIGCSTPVHRAVHGCEITKNVDPRPEHQYPYNVRKGSQQIQTGLRRQLGLTSATAVVIGEVIAVGIFLTPAEMSKTIGSPLLVAAVWIVVGILSLLGALCYGELAARYPEAGGGYVYLREAFGPRLAFLYGWKCFLVMDPGLAAALSVGLAGYAGYIVGLSPVASKAVAVACILIIAAANILGVRLGAFFVRWLTALKLGLLAFIIIWAFAFGSGDWSHFLPLASQRPGSSPLAAALAIGLVSAFFSCAGWWDVSKLAGEVRNPQRVLPRALLFGILIVTAVYLATSAVFVYLVPMERVTSGETFAAQAGEALFGRSGGLVFSAIVIVSVFGSLAAIIMAAPRVYYAMARNGVFPRSAASIHPRYGTPVRAIMLQAALACILVLLGNFSQIVAYFIFITVAFVAITVAGLFVLRKRHGTGSGYLVPGYPYTPVAFLALAAILLLLLVANNPWQALIGTAIVGLGIPSYTLFFSRGASVAQEACPEPEEL
ncbi:MAG TPA: amino acid permease [Blastocatellia bacterium]|nr:amino acid permease [Blastocatellia bacterium]